MLGRLVNFLLGVMIVGGGECWSVVNVVRFPRPTPRRWVGGPTSQKGGDETVSVSASFRCSLMGQCDTDLEFCLSKDSSGAPKVGNDHRWKVQGEFESRVRAMKSFTQHSRDINAKFTRQ